MLWQPGSWRGQPQQCAGFSIMVQNPRSQDCDCAAVIAIQLANTKDALQPQETTRHTDIMDPADTANEDQPLIAAAHSSNEQNATVLNSSAPRLHGPSQLLSLYAAHFLTTWGEVGSSSVSGLAESGTSISTL